MYVCTYTYTHRNMAEGPDPASQSSQNKSSCQEEEEPAIIEPDVTCGHCEKELNNPYLLCCLHSVCAECLPNMVVENVHLKCSQCEDTSTAWNDGKMSEKECRVDRVHCFPIPNGPLARYIEGKALAELLKNQLFLVGIRHARALTTSRSSTVSNVPPTCVSTARRAMNPWTTSLEFTP